MIIYRHDNNYKINNFTIYGERHSGTKFIAQLIDLKFNLPITWEYGWKHFFGWHNDKIINQAQHTMFIGIVRNPYDWIMAMNKHAYHVPHKISKDIDSLLFSEWLSLDNHGKERINEYNNYEDRNYITNSRYKNIFDLRYHKNMYLYFDMPKVSYHYALIRYEDLIESPFITIKNISDIFNLSINTNSKNPKPRNKPYNINMDIRYKISSNIKWDVENKLNYYVIH